MSESRGWRELTVGYVLVTAGLLLDLPTIGASEIPVVVSIGIAALIAAGILLGAAGMLRLRAALPAVDRGARRGLGLQGTGMIVLLLGVLALQVSSSITVLLVSAVLVAVAAVMTIAGVLLLRRHHIDVGIERAAQVDYLLIGVALIFVGVIVILGSKLGYYFLLPDVTSTVVNDAGAAISACGCVIAAHSSFLMRASIRDEEQRTHNSSRTFAATG